MHFFVPVYLSWYTLNMQELDTKSPGSLLQPHSLFVSPPHQEWNSLEIIRKSPHILQKGRLRARGSVGDIHATAHPLGFCILLALRSKTHCLATFVLGSPQNSPTFHLTELLLEPVNPHSKGHTVMDEGMTQHPKSFQRLG